MLTSIFLGSLTWALRAHSAPAPSAVGPVDYIVVGGGTSGATLAARIAEDRGVTVAVIEAGDDQVKNNLFAFIPGADVLGVGWYPNDTVNYDWNFVTEPQAGAANRRMHYARGKGLGGTSNRNFMLFHRPTEDAFEYWVNATSVGSSPGWTWNDVYPYFTKSSILPPPNNLARVGHVPNYNPAAYPETDPKNAPLATTFPNYVFPYSDYLQGAFDEYGYPNNTAAFSGGDLNGVGYAISTINQVTSHRSTSQFFIDNALSNGLNNLKVVLNARVTKVNFDGNKNAVSVNYVQGGKTYTIQAKREIILSAGVFQTPQILMLSGIGPAAQLQKFNIPVLVDLPGVGRNFQDHVFFTPGYEIKPSIYNFGHESQLLELVVTGVSFFTGTGSLTHPVSDFLGWQRVNQSFINSKPELAILGKYPKLWPHIEYIAAGGLVADFHNLLTENIVPAYAGKYYYSLEAVIIAPQSRGTVTLATADPLALPLINPNWLTSKTDQTLAIEMYRKVRRLFNTTSFRAARNNDQEFYPGYQVQSDADILSVIQKSVQTLWHGASTCAMQPRNNNGVLDPYLRVYGVNNLRVVDASAFPSLLPGHPQSVLYMLAERATDFLKQARGAPITTVPRTPPPTDGRLPYDGPN